MKLFTTKAKSPVIHVDFPVKTPRASVFKVQGWIVSNEPIDFVSLDGINLDFYQRPDVEIVHRGFTHIKGFHGTINFINFDDNSLVFEYSINNKLCEFVHTLVPNPMYSLSKQEKFKKFRAVFPNDKPELLIEKSFTLALDKTHSSEWEKQKKEKQKKISHHLICPECKKTLELAGKVDGSFVCNSCNESYHSNKIPLDLLTEKTKKYFNIQKTNNVAARAHDPLALSIIGKYSDGLILDCGAGYPFVEYRNVINYEIAPYPSTDILGVGEKLPFAENTFDAVFSFSVLEHVKNPFLCAEELSRVLKSNGLLYCSVPFLQPFHAYPHHYYNMTSLGLKSLFENEIEVLQSGVPISGIPIFTLNWILKSWADDLEGVTKQEFLNLSIKDLLNDPEQYLLKSFVNDLSAEKSHELACTTMILGKKSGT